MVRVFFEWFEINLVLDILSHSSSFTFQHYSYFSRGLSVLLRYLLSVPQPTAPLLFSMFCGSHNPRWWSNEKHTIERLV